MGMGGISIWQLLIILVIVLLLFGTKRLKNIGGDLGSAVKGFRSAMSDPDRQEKDNSSTDQLAERSGANDAASESARDKTPASSAKD